VTSDERPPSTLGKAASILLALLPPARMAWIVFSNGENNLSNDYIARVPLVTSMLDGTVSLGTFVRAAWIGGSHSTLAVTPIYYLNARFFAWSVWFELCLGLALVAATLALLAGAIPRSMRWLLLPLLSLLLFSTSRVTVFTFGEPSLQYGLSQFGVAIGALALARCLDRPVPLTAALALGGILASWSWGGGIMVWPIFGVVLVLFRVRTPAAWVILVGGAIAGLAQYAWFLPRQIAATTAAHVPWATKARIFLDVLGRPFVNGIGHADLNAWSQAAGASALLGLAVLLVMHRKRLRELLVPLFLISWALLVATQIALVRAAVAPWYASPPALFWAGLLMLFAASSAPMRIAGLLAIAVLSLIVQFTWEDKSFYLPSRTPVSAACLREWRTAPPECHARVFQWGEGQPGELTLLGELLEKHRLSVFGPRRTYLLQGDAFLGRVRLEPESSPSFFSADGQTRADVGDYRRLDLVLAQGGSVIWRVDLPQGTRRATFSTVVHAAPGDPQLARGARVSVTMEGSPVFLEELTFLPSETARPLSVDLSSLAGKRITLRLFGEETHEGDSPLVFEAPRVVLALDPGQNLLRP
jgi:hypothetical protein